MSSPAQFIGQSFESISHDEFPDFHPFKKRLGSAVWLSQTTIPFAPACYRTSKCYVPPAGDKPKVARIRCAGKVRWLMDRPMTTLVNAFAVFLISSIAANAAEIRVIGLAGM